MENRKKRTVNRNAFETFLSAELQGYLIRGRNNELAISYDYDTVRIGHKNSLDVKLPEYITSELLSKQADAFRAGVFTYLKMFSRFFRKKFDILDYVEWTEALFVEYEVPVIVFGRYGFVNNPMFMNDIAEEACALFATRWEIPAFRSRLSIKLGIKNGEFTGEDREREMILRIVRKEEENDNYEEER